MSLVKFISGSSSELLDKEYEEGAIYFIFPDGQHDNGHIYLDIRGVRHEISASYDDTDIIERLLELERLTLIPCESLTLSNDILVVSVGSSALLTATATPTDVTNQIFWSTSDNSVCEITNINTTDNVSVATLSAVSGGTCTITATCGNYSQTCSIQAQTGILVEHTILENYQSDGSSFVYNAPISLDNGQYIEASISVANVTQVKQNIFSVGQNINLGSGTGYRLHFYTSATASKIKTTVRMFIVDNPSTQSNIEYNFGNSQGDIKIKLDVAGIWINEHLFVPTNSANAQNMWNDIIEHFRDFSAFEVGSAEGTTRSTAYYNYIKYYAYEEG